jgi:proteasome accessory factor A
MAIPKILGTETEYGITVKNSATFDPISNSVLIVNSYQGGQTVQTIWDYEEENPSLMRVGSKSIGKLMLPEAVRTPR